MFSLLNPLKFAEPSLEVVSLDAPILSLTHVPGSGSQ